jgi:hypothetical protein
VDDWEALNELPPAAKSIEMPPSSQRLKWTVVSAVS